MLWTMAAALAAPVAVGGWAANEVVHSGPDFQGIAALVTAIGGIIAILLSAYLNVRGKKANNDEVKDEIIKELLEQLVEKKAEQQPPRKRTRRPPDAGA